MDSSSLSTALPLVAAAIYVVSALLVKRAASYGLGVWRTAFVTNVIVACVMSLLLFLGGNTPVHLLWQPAIVAGLFVAGQTLQFLALTRGDVSVAVPVFGVKVILVAWFTTVLLTEPVSGRLWSAAVLSVLALVCLNRRDRERATRHLGITLFGAGLGSVCFAMFDVLVQRWVNGAESLWGGPGRFLPIMFGMGAVFSLVLVPFFHAPLSEAPKVAWAWLAPSAVLMGCQSALFVCAIIMFGHATTANILYSSRGLWSVVAVWLVGHWFANDEQNLAAHVLRWRFAGSILMMGAIGLAIKW